jgi:hypothetical protein
MRLAGVGVLCALLLATPAAGQPSSSVIRADRASQQLGSFRVRSDPTMRGVTRVFGRPRSCRLTSSISSTATWNRFALRVAFATLGGIPPGRTACTYREMRINWIRATGARWRTGLGLRVGDSVAELRRLYPRARFQRRPIGSWPAPSYWLVHYRERCVIGDCPTRFHRVPKLIASIGGGRVRALFLPVGAQGE